MADQPSLPSQGTEAIIQTDPVDAPSPGAPRVVVVAASGKEAINLCAEFLPDLVLLDINMPVMNGIEACAEISC